MANYSSLISAINAAIKQNGNQEITGPVLNSVLNAMVSSLGNGRQFGGVVTPASNPGSPDQKMFYLAWTPGAYTGFGGKVLEENKLGIFTKTGSTVTLDTVNLGGGPGTYVVTDLELLEPTSATSEQIDEAIGGFDNLVAAIQSGAVVLSADTTNYQHAYKIAVAELGDTDEGLASITILDTSKLSLERYTISKSSSGELSLKLFTISVKPINNVYTVGMKGLKNTSNSNEIITAIGSWPNLFSALSDNKIIMEVPTESEPYGSLYICHIVTGTRTAGVIQLSTLDSSSGNYVLKTYTISAASAARLSVTVESISYVTSTDVEGTYQKITDNTLDTTDKTIVGAINEVNTGLKSAVKPYVVDLTDLLAAQDSDSISTAIGGIDNLNGTVQKNQVIFGILANGTVAVGIRVLGNQTTLTYFVDSVVGLTVNEVIITNTSGALTKTVNTHAVLTENMVVDNLESDEATLPLSAAQGKVLLENAESTYQKITDNALSTTAKTVVGAINEVNKKVSEIPESETYEITLLSSAMTLDKRPDKFTSEEIDAAIGGWDNLKAAVLEGKSIKEIVNYSSGDATLQIYLSYEASITTVPSEDIEGIGLSISRLENYIIGDYDAINIQIFNNNGILTLSYLVNGVFIKGKEYEDLQTTDKTIIGGINELKSSVNTNTGNVTRIDRAVGNPVIEEVDLSAPTLDNKYWLISKVQADSVGYAIKVLSLAKGDLLIFNAYGSTSVAILGKVTPDNSKMIDVIEVGVNKDKTVGHFAEEDCTVAISFNKSSTYDAYIIKSPFNTAISDNSYMQYLHKVYEEYGAVYNKETGYWELNGLTDLTEEDMWDIYLWTSNLINQPNLDNAFFGSPIRTTFTPPIKSIYKKAKGCSLNQACLDCASLEVFNISRISDSQLALSNEGTAMHNAFRGCVKLRSIKTVLYIVGSNSASLFTEAFSKCAELSYVKIRGLRQAVSFQDSPLLSYESLNYLVTSAANTKAITVTVHPTTYSYLTGTAQPTEEVGGTTEEWQALVTTAQGKQISFAQPAETLEVEPLE